MRSTVAAVLAATVIVFTILWLHDESLRGVRARPVALFGPVQRVAPTLTQDMTLKLDWKRGSTVRAGAATGTVTAVLVRAGDALDPSGPGPYAIDAVPIAWFPGTTPPFRDIELGDAGADVDEVGAFLAARGLLPPGRKAYQPVDATFVHAVARYAVSIGVALPVAPEPVRFLQSWVVWLPPGSGGRITNVAVAVGDAAPAPGTPILTTGAGLARATIETDAGTQSDGSDNPAAVPTLLAAATARRQLVIGPDHFAFDGTNVPAPAVPRLERVVAPGTANTSVVTQAHFSSDTFVVPPGALIPSADGSRMCVAHRDVNASSGVHAHVEQVHVVGADESGAIVTGHLGATAVLFNPGEMGDTWCP